MRKNQPPDDGRAAKLRAAVAMQLAHQRLAEAGVEIAAGIRVGQAASQDLRGTR
ncbi:MULTISPECIES: hypothetical protein [unclassified Mycolicibacterium]|uniref:hypothetical protein n=1 Tax=unclassified Mycolicibacterium TaxID=2636767 RepID=UPI0012DF657D|nr:MULTISPECIES: hypothetical protein [unclassified Mycolicibacterium]